MSRDVNGTYTLPASGNPVITGTTISSSWANTTLNDVASALTDSLSRSGLGGMTAALKLFAGTSALPGLAWSLETTSGLYRAGAGDFRWVVATDEILRIQSNQVNIAKGLTVLGTVPSLGSGVILSSVRPSLGFDETDATSTNRRWELAASNEAFLGRTYSDDISTATTWLQVDRTGITVDTINFPNGVLQYGGIEVGYRGLPPRTISGTGNTAATDAGGLIIYSGTGGHIFTLDSDIATNGVVSIVNGGSGVLLIAAGVTLSWYNGSGAIATGTRTLAVGGVATAWHSGGGSFAIWGAGLT